MKVSIIYVSQTGNTEAAAEYIEDGILEKYPFVQVKRMDISEDEVDVEFLQTSDAVIFGSPVYFTSMSWELKRWFDNSFRIDPGGPAGSRVCYSAVARGWYGYSADGNDPAYVGQRHAGFCREERQVSDRRDSACSEHRCVTKIA